MAVDPSIDIDAETGADIAGWAHVLQSIQDFFVTGFGERVQREWYGSVIPRFLGENLTTSTVVPFFAAIASAMEQWEPRYRLTRVVPESVGRDGKLRVYMEGEYRPRALLGDFSSQGAKRVTVLGGNGGTFEVQDG